MSERAYNFSAGPATLPAEVLEASASGLVDYDNSGVGIAEMSHRGPEFIAVLEEAEARCRSLLSIPDNYEVLFLQGGATQQFSLIPMNLLSGSADYLITGQWAKKAYDSAALISDKVKVVANSSDQNYNYIPEESSWELDSDADYLHVCSNNTIFGTQLKDFPKHNCLIADMSSDIMSRELDVSQFGVIYAGAQKNLGPSGVVLVIIRKDLLEREKATQLPPIFDYSKHAGANSCLNTAPTFGIYMLLQNFRWLDKNGGIAAMEQQNIAKAKLIYDAIDNSNGFYTGTVANAADRSNMNITFTLPTEELTAEFIKAAKEKGMVALKGYRSVGGIRASVYNAMPVAGCQALADLMVEFASRA